MVPYSILDFVTIIQGQSPTAAFANTLDLAQHAEKLGYTRIWLAEHHNMPGVGSAATSVVIGYVAGGTTTIRVGAGGVMLPNHAPLLIAEQFGTLAALYPDRIDLGLGRAPGTDMATVRALRRNPGADTYGEDVLELASYFHPAKPNQLVQAVPGAGQNVPIWLLGSSTASARLAAMLGLPFGFASHFAPAYLHAALDIYRSEFRPSTMMPKPYALIGVNVFAADTDDAAKLLATSVKQQFLAMQAGRGAQPLPPPDARYMDVDLDMLAYAVTGSPDTVAAGLARIVAETGANELMIASQIYDHAARLRSFELLAGTRTATTRP